MSCDPCWQFDAHGAMIDWTARQTFYGDGTAINMCVSGVVWTTPAPTRFILPTPWLVTPDKVAALSAHDPGPWGACGQPGAPNQTTQAVLPSQAAQVAAPAWTSTEKAATVAGVGALAVMGYLFRHRLGLKL